MIHAHWAEKFACKDTKKNLYVQIIYDFVKFISIYHNNIVIYNGRYTILSCTFKSPE